MKTESNHKIKFKQIQEWGYDIYSSFSQFCSRRLLSFSRSFQPEDSLPHSYPTRIENEGLKMAVVDDKENAPTEIIPISTGPNRDIRSLSSLSMKKSLLAPSCCFPLELMTKLEYHQHAGVTGKRDPSRLLLSSPSQNDGDFQLSYKDDKKYRNYQYLYGIMSWIT